ncbi:MAG TPA: hypothetical protein QGH10_19175 [Armatimonadota bacterium]|nr:hypothetical protein [Armatimonadota bacterium]
MVIEDSLPQRSTEIAEGRARVDIDALLYQIPHHIQVPIRSSVV